MPKKKYNYRFVITKYKGHYEYFDMCAYEFSAGIINNSYEGYRVTKDNSVYIKYSWDELEDYYCDIGSCYDTVKEERYQGKLILETSDEKELIKKFVELTGVEPEIENFEEGW